MAEYTLREEIPSVEAYQKLRAAVGWYLLNHQATKRALQNSLYCVCLYHGDEVVGCGRVIGDQGIYYYIQDIIVLPEHQRKHQGSRIMNAVMDFLKRTADSNSFIGLMAAENVSGFYEKYGFAPRPTNRPGMFRVWQA